MNKNVIEILEERLDTLSKGRKRIARYVLAYLPKAAFQTAAAIAAQTEVSESTVVRFAADLGYEGFPQLQEALKQIVMSRLEAGVTEEGPRRYEANAEKEISTAAETARSGRRLYLIASGETHFLALYMGRILDKWFSDVYVITSDSGKLRYAGPEDRGIVIDFPPYSREAAQMAEACASTGAKLIGITNHEQSPVCAWCEQCLFAHPEKTSFGVSYMAPLALIEQLLDQLSYGKDGNAHEI